VPTGRGKGLESVQLSPAEYEKALNWIYRKQIELGDKIFFKPTDAPHYMRLLKQKQRQRGAAVATHNPTVQHRGSANSISRGCLAGTGFCFISHLGKVKGCGYLDIEAGDLNRQSFGEIWENSPLFNRLRDLSNLKGKCGKCDFRLECGGCRARAYGTTGDYLEAEPYCLYQPKKQEIC
jgi:radical SAM protein with 4Fe4S-binding SPASM domain